MYLTRTKLTKLPFLEPTAFFLRILASFKSCPAEKAASNVSCPSSLGPDCIFSPARLAATFLGLLTASTYDLDLNKAVKHMGQAPILYLPLTAQVIAVPSH